MNNLTFQKTFLSFVNREKKKFHAFQRHNTGMRVLENCFSNKVFNK